MGIGILDCPNCEISRCQRELRYALSSIEKYRAEPSLSSAMSSTLVFCCSLCGSRITFGLKSCKNHERNYFTEANLIK